MQQQQHRAFDASAFDKAPMQQQQQNIVESRDKAGGQVVPTACNSRAPNNPNPVVQELPKPREKYPLSTFIQEDNMMNDKTEGAGQVYIQT